MYDEGEDDEDVEDEDEDEDVRRLRRMRTRMRMRMMMMMMMTMRELWYKVQKPGVRRKPKIIVNSSWEPTTEVKIKKPSSN